MCRYVSLENYFILLTFFQPFIEQHTIFLDTFMHSNSYFLYVYYWCVSVFLRINEPILSLLDILMQMFDLREIGTWVYSLRHLNDIIEKNVSYKSCNSIAKTIEFTW